MRIAICVKVMSKAVGAIPGEEPTILVLVHCVVRTRNWQDMMEKLGIQGIIDQGAKLKNYNKKDKFLSKNHSILLSKSTVKQ